MNARVPGLAADAGLELVDARYFMFFLSPLLMAARWKRPPLESMSPEAIEELLAHTLL